MRSIIFVQFLMVTPCATAGLIVLPNGSSVFNTGFDENGLSLSNGELDPHYEMTLNPANSAIRPFVTSAFFLTPNTTASQWVGPAGSSTVVGGDYGVRTSIDLSGIDVTNFYLEGLWLSDNTGSDIIVNGFSTGQSNSGSHTNELSSRPENAFRLSTGLVSGLNTIDFNWQNFGFNPTAVRVEFTSFGTTSAVPEPSSLVCLSALGTLVFLKRRRRSF